MNRQEYIEALKNKMLSSGNLKLGEEFCSVVSRVVSAPIESILDVGCGFGIAATFMQSLSNSITLLDIDETALSYVRDIFDEKALVHSGTIFGLNEKYDLIYYFLSLHHISDINTELSQVKKLMKDNSWLVICEIEHDHIYPFHVTEKPPHDGFKERELATILINCGYEIKTLKNLSPILTDKLLYNVTCYFAWRKQ